MNLTELNSSVLLDFNLELIRRGRIETRTTVRVLPLTDLVSDRFERCRLYAVLLMIGVKYREVFLVDNVERTIV